MTNENDRQEAQAIMTITAFDRANLRSMREEITLALKPLADKHGIIIDLGNIRFSGEEFKAQVIGKTVAVTGPAPLGSSPGYASPIPAAPVSSVLALRCARDSLDPNKPNVKGWKIVDYKAGNHKYPWIVAARSGTRYKISHMQAKTYFGVAVTPVIPPITVTPTMPDAGAEVDFAKATHKPHVNAGTYDGEF